MKDGGIDRLTCYVLDRGPLYSCFAPLELMLGEGPTPLGLVQGWVEVLDYV